MTARGAPNYPSIAIKISQMTIFLLYKDNITFYITINNFIQYQMVVDIFIFWDKIYKQSF